MLLELLTYAAGMATPVGYLLTRRRKPRYHDPLEDSSIAWSYSTKHSAFKCPACTYAMNRNQPQCCVCHEYPREHFHFKCADCKFTAIMRTADDPIDRERKLGWMQRLTAQIGRAP